VTCAGKSLFYWGIVPVLGMLVGCESRGIPGSSPTKFWRSHNAADFFKKEGLDVLGGGRLDSSPETAEGQFGPWHRVRYFVIVKADDALRQERVTKDSSWGYTALIKRLMTSYTNAVRKEIAEENPDAVFEGTQFSGPDEMPQTLAYYTRESIGYVSVSSAFRNTVPLEALSRQLMLHYADEPVDVVFLRVEMCELAYTDVDQCRKMMRRR
jgi:hypothetical protein